MEINQAGIDLIKKFEGCKLEAYKDIVGKWTIGYGHTGKEAYAGAVITPEVAQSLLLDDLRVFNIGVSSLQSVELNENQFSALVCFAYNVGLGNLKSSTLLKCIHNKQFDEAAIQFLNWDKAGGRQVMGLLRRRKAESDLFKS